MSLIDTYRLDGEAYDDESVDDESVDDESVDDESEFLGGLGSILGGPAAAIGNALGGLFGGGPRRPPLPPVQVPSPGGGVSTATLNTPQGSATLRLPEPVVTRTEFETTVRRLQEGINRDSARTNTISKDLDTLRTRVGAVVADTQRDIGRVRASVAQARRANRAAIARLQRAQSQQNMMSMMMAMMAQRRAQEEFSDHVHDKPATGATEFTGPPSDGTGGGNDSMMFMLPMLMQPSDGSSGDSSMMMMPLMMMAMNR
jgi:hypothetical protein